MNLEKFFDQVNHDILMAREARKVKDKAILKLIRAYLNARVMKQGITKATTEGTPQVGPLSPLLANILLDDLDKEHNQRGHRFVSHPGWDSPLFVLSQILKQNFVEVLLDKVTVYLLKMGWKQACG